LHYALQGGRRRSQPRSHSPKNCPPVIGGRGRSPEGVFELIINNSTPSRFADSPYKQGESYRMHYPKNSSPVHRGTDERSKYRRQIYLHYALQGGGRRSQSACKAEGFITHSSSKKRYSLTILSIATSPSSFPLIPKVRYIADFR
jgi:hypothetical protein